VLKATRYRVQNFRNIDDSGWIPLERVTAFVGRNESGKTTLLKALHKFNPATPEPYNPQREFPRDRYTRDFRNGADWPVCSVAFELSDSLRSEMQALVSGAAPPKEAICTRFYDGSLETHFDPEFPDNPVEPKPVIQALNAFAGAARRLAASTPDLEEQTRKLRTDLATWASAWQAELEPHAESSRHRGRRASAEAPQGVRGARQAADC
jgi:energy-coupling factor transporter ATP-binding protein EcfA2